MCSSCWEGSMGFCVRETKTHTHGCQRRRDRSNCPFVPGVHGPTESTPRCPTEQVPTQVPTQQAWPGLRTRGAGSLDRGRATLGGALRGPGSRDSRRREWWYHIVYIPHKSGKRRRGVGFGFVAVRLELGGEMVI